jgi:hypothetical protein
MAAKENGFKDFYKFLSPTLEYVNKITTTWIHNGIIPRLLWF